MAFDTRALFIDYNKRLLAPTEFWSSKYSIYKDLVRHKLILHDDYSKVITQADVDYLTALKIILAKPLVYRTKIATKTDLKYVLSNSESITSLCDEKGEIKPFEIHTSDIPYLVTTDENILARTGGSFKAAKALLKFIMLQVLEEDELFDKHGMIGGLDYMKSIWVSRLRETQWVPVKSIEDDNASLKPEKPSTSNLSQLLKDEEDLLALLNNKKAAIFLNLLGISVADLIRNTITDADQKLQWDLAFTKLLTNKNLSPQLATEMLEDPGLQEIYEKKQAEKKRIHENQIVGYLFESIFKQIFESEEFKNEGFRIKRVPIGSDFGVVFDNDIVDEQGYEVLFEIKGILIELKATGKNYAEMTPTQVNKATEKPNIKYVLSVLPLDNFAINEDTVREHTRFITNIGESLNQKHEEYEEYTATKNLIAQDNSDIRLHIEDGKVRYQVKAELWRANDAKNFAVFLDWIKSAK